MSEETTPQTEATPKPEGNGETPTKDDVLEVLKMVIDPELGINVVDLGLVYEVEVDDDSVKVVYTLTSMGCPVGPLIEQQIQQVITTLPGVGVVESKCTFDPPWSMERMTEDARLAMGMF
jgi:metal-sulfur cluster biosynthetic enzyme